jgi:xylan 1,4-beta-xylosidase
MIQNPILPGFHPDPSICRVGGDYFIATSTFEWWPAVRIHHSKDLVNWAHQSYAVTRRSQLDLRGRPDSAGVWAPCLSHAHGKFWLIYTDVRSLYGAYKDTHNYLITADSIDGPWSEPVFLNSSGFDPSLFHDDNGKSWLLNQQWLHHPGLHPFNGILLQEFDRELGKLVGPVKNIFMGTALGVVEGPHIYKRNGWYYLLTAEGGTSFQHAATVARSRQLDGPYEVMPANPMLTALNSPTSTLQKAGHASWTNTEQGEWYMAHLCGRPLEWNGPYLEQPQSTNESYANLHCILGRETALQKFHWRDDDWPELNTDGNFPCALVQPPKGVAIADRIKEVPCDHFDLDVLSPHWNSLRTPVDSSWLSLSERPGFVRLRGRESLMSCFEQSLLARRQQHFHCRAETSVDFHPDSFQQMAGLVAYYNTFNHVYFHVTVNPANQQKILRLMCNHDGVPSEPIKPIVLAVDCQIRLALEIDHDKLVFSYGLGTGSLTPVGITLDARCLSDEYAWKSRDGVHVSLGFTGNFVGLACQDLGGTRTHADFDYFTYEELSRSTKELAL